MPTKTINEQMILEELHFIAEERWGEVLTFIRSLRPGKELPVAERPIQKGADLADSELIGIWAEHPNIKNSRDFAQQLRYRAEHR